MYSVKILHNYLHPDEPVETEVYLGTTDATIGGCSPDEITEFIDGCPSCNSFFDCAGSGGLAPHPRLADRILLHYYLQNINFASPLYCQYYLNNTCRPNLFNDPMTNDNTLIHPLFSAESRDVGGFYDYMGKPLRESFRKTIFSVENLWHSAAMDYTNGDNNYPVGGAHWFESSQLLSQLKNASVIKVTRSGICSGQFLNPFLLYEGPGERNIQYQFWITNQAGTTIYGPIQGLTNEYSTNTPGVNFNSFPPCALNVLGAYTAHMSLAYAGACAHEFTTPFDVVDQFTLTALTPIDVCEGTPVKLQANRYDNLCTAIDLYKVTPNGSVFIKDDSNTSPSFSGEFVVLESGEYYAELRDQSCTAMTCGTTTVTNHLTVTIHPNPEVEITRSCESGIPNSVTLVAQTYGSGASGPISYLWSTGNTTNQITVASYLDAGEIYSLRVTNLLDQCSREVRYSVPLFDTNHFPDDVPAINIPTITASVACPGLSDLNILTPTTDPIQVNLTPSFSNQRVELNSEQAPNNYTFTCLPPGSYTINLTGGSGNGCSMQQTVVIPCVAPPNITFAITQVTGCHLNNNGSIQANVTGGTAPYTYRWFPDGETTSLIQNKMAGSYMVLVTDAVGCSDFQYVTLTEQNAAPLQVTTTYTKANCQNTGGSITTLASGGSPGYTYQWLTGQTSATITNLSSGNYQVTVTDAAGCSVTVTRLLDRIPPYQISTESTPSCNNDGTASVMVCGGKPFVFPSDPYTYAWSPIGGITETATGLQPGTYTVTITDNGGCGSTTAQVVVNAALNCCSSAGAALSIPPVGLTIDDNNSSTYSAAFVGGGNITVNGDLLINTTSPFLINNNTTLNFAKDVYLKVMPSAFLTINNATLQACGDMWGGIKAAPLSTTVITGSSTLIKDAKEAFYADGSNIGIDIENSTFDQNHIAITLKNGNFQNAIILTNTIKCTGNYLNRNPFNGQQPPEHILLQDATGVKIGAAGNGNIFSDAINGIGAERSNVEVYSNTFSNFRYQMQGLGIGYAIKAKGDNINQYTLTVGTSAADKNTITDCQMGIYSYLGMNCEIHNNQISFVNTGIIASSSQNRNIHIYDNLILNFKSYGINVQNCDNSVVHIERNHMNDNLLFTAGAESAKGIYVNHTVRSKPVLTIKENWIYNCKFGIQLMQQDKGYVTANHIFYAVPDNLIIAPTYRYGILTQNCTGVSVSYNEIKRNNCVGGGCTTNINMEKYLIGICTDVSQLMAVHDNYVENMARANRIYSDCSQSLFTCNFHQNCYTGFWFESVILGAQGNTNWSVGDGWNWNVGGSPGYRIDGNNHTAIDWYFDLSNGPNYILDGTNSNPNAVTPWPLNLGTLFCSNFPPVKDPGSVLQLGTQTNFIENQNEIIQLNRKKAYSVLKDSLQLMYGGSIYDTDLQTFFSLMALSNIGAVDDIERYLQNNDLANALLHNNELNPENLQQQNEKLVNTICMQIAEDTITYDSLQRLQLINIAYQYPLIGGTAVYRARAILKLDIDDTEIEYRKGINTPTTENSFALYPNPNSGSFALSYRLAETEKANVIIYDAVGKIMARQDLSNTTNSSFFDLNNFGNGIYSLHVKVSSGIEKHWKIIVVK